MAVPKSIVDMSQRRAVEPQLNLEIVEVFNRFHQAHKYMRDPLELAMAVTFVKTLLPFAYFTTHDELLACNVPPKAGAVRLVFPGKPEDNLLVFWKDTEAFSVCYSPNPQPDGTILEKVFQKLMGDSYTNELTLTSFTKTPYTGGDEVIPFNHEALVDVKSLGYQTRPLFLEAYFNFLVELRWCIEILDKFVDGSFSAEEVEKYMDTPRTCTATKFVQRRYGFISRMAGFNQSLSLSGEVAAPTITAAATPLNLKRPAPEISTHESEDESNSEDDNNEEEEEEEEEDDESPAENAHEEEEEEEEEESSSEDLSRVAKKLVSYYSL